MSPRGLHAGAQKSPSICLVPNISAEVEELAAAEAAKAGPSPWGFGYTFGALIIGIGFCGPLYYSHNKEPSISGAGGVQGLVGFRVHAIEQMLGFRFGVRFSGFGGQESQ